MQLFLSGAGYLTYGNARRPGFAKQRLHLMSWVAYYIGS